VCSPGANLPKDEQTWLEKHPGKDWNRDRDNLLPGYYDVRLPARRPPRRIKTVH
jgi:hypothetical protein